MKRLNRVSFVLLISLCTRFVSAQYDTDVEDPPESQIIGGANAIPGQYPWQAMLLEGGGFVCGGSLIHAQWVLTAAHCWTQGKNYTVRLGSIVRDSFEAGRIDMHIPSANFFLHPNYTTNPLRNDVAMIKLPYLLTLPSNTPAGARIGMIRLAKDKKKLFVSETGIMSGWGRTNSTDTSVYAQTLQWVSNPIISNDACATVMGTNNIYNGTICTSTSATSGVCNGDSGGPLVIKEKDKKYTLVGVSSFVSTSACIAGHSAFARVSFFSDWINKRISSKI